MEQNTNTDHKLRTAYENGLKTGRIEGMIAYQKHLIENLQKENELLNKQLQKQKDVPKDNSQN